jgi:hypothetical protein
VARIASSDLIRQLLPVVVFKDSPLGVVAALPFPVEPAPMSSTCHAQPEGLRSRWLSCPDATGTALCVG